MHCLLALLMSEHCAPKRLSRTGRLFPPQLDLLLAWSTMFRSPYTWSNYLGYVRTACMLVKAPVEVWRSVAGYRSSPCLLVCVVQVLEHPALRRAKTAIASSGQFVRRERMFIQQCASRGFSGATLHATVAGSR